MMKHCTNCGEPVVDTAKFCHKCGTKVLPPVSLIPPAERDDDEDDLVYQGSFKKKKMKRALAVNDEKIPGIIRSGSGPGGIGTGFGTGFGLGFTGFGPSTGPGPGTGTGTGSIFPGRAISCSSAAALEVKNGRAKATLEDRVTTKETKSRYGVDPKNVEKRVAEIWTVGKRPNSLSFSCAPSFN